MAIPSLIVFLLHAVVVQLDEPLWVSVYASQEIAAEVMGLCLQLDTLILSSSQKVRCTLVLMREDWTEY